MTNYIESKLNPDGRTYDHSEVIEAHRNGAKIRRFDDYGYDIPSDKPAWWPTSKYRAVIEDKTIDQRLSGSDKTCFQESEFLDALAEHIREKFPSEPVNLGGRMVDVDYITLTRAEVNELFPGLLK